MKRNTFGLLIFSWLILGFVFGCSAQPNDDQAPAITEQQVRDAVTELIGGINNGDMEVVSKYVGTAGPVAEKLVNKMKNNVKLYDVRDISIQGTSVQATATLEVIPLNVKKDVTLEFNATDVLVLNNPLGLLSLFINN